ncbi:MAG TPA: signal recognition particle-docking protein FtsY [Micropepsaceae bacterium]|nr:signal recognition particle-docking protein FtsY [Micropepsaceae bacterium]
MSDDTLKDVPAKKGMFARLKAGLKRSTDRLADGVTALFTKRKLDADAVFDLEELLITSDLGPGPARKIAKAIGARRHDKDITPAELRDVLAEEIAALLAPAEKNLLITDAKPHVILVVGVNGGGKTTTIGKLAARFASSGRKVMIAAGDTFRAAAIDQLKVWGERANVPVIARAPGSDAASLAHDALSEARNAGADVLLIDTAGRLQNKAGLMQELAKIVRVLKKQSPDAPHETLLVLDATTGQNAVAQAEIFGATAGVTGLAVTKLDGTARGGVLVQIVERFGLPVRFIGFGEAIDELAPFEAKTFARALVGLETFGPDA